MSSRRRRNYGVKRPTSQVSVVTSVIGGVAVFLHVVFLSLSIAGLGGGSKAMAGIGVISAVVCVVALIKSIEPFRDTSYDTLTRWTGLLFPVAGFAAWTITYFIGIIFG